ncbi:unnamed protein product [Rhizophagus irregularis]|nr:unnamed protein product [Rhizophagus irregularis]
MLTIAPIFEKSEHEEVQVFDPAYFTSDHSWSLLSFLFYRQQQSDFQFDKKEEHARYIRNLSNILKRKQVNETIANLAGSALATFQNEKKSQLVKDFWEGAISSQKRKVATIHERTALMEEHTTGVANSVFQQDQVVREKYMRRLNNTDFLEGENHSALASEDPKKENSKKRPAEEAPSIITPAPNLRGRSPPPSYKSVDNSFDAEASTPSPSNGHDVSDTGIHEDEVENPFITNYEEGSRNNNKFKTILSWQHAINRIYINDASTNDWVADGHNISLDFREFQLTSINLLETNQTFSYAKDIDRILCLSSIMYCNEVKPEFVTCSEKVWNKIRPRPLVPKMLPSVVQLIIIEYNMFLNDKQLLDIKWHENWVKWSTLSTDEDKSIFDCAQEVTKNFFTYLILEEIFSKDDFSLIWANGESESSKERRILNGNNHGRKPDFRVLSKIDDVNMEFLFGEIKPPSNSTSINKGIVKLAEFTKGSLDLIINSYGYVDGLETYGVLIHGNEIKIFSMDLTFDGLYRYNQLSKILLPTENANFLNILTVISTFYSLLERIRSTIVTMNSSKPLSSSGHLYCRKSNSSPKKIRVPIVRV